MGIPSFQRQRALREGASSDGRVMVVRRTTAATLAAAALLFGVSAARAAPFVDVTYDLGDSSAISTVLAATVELSTLTPPQLSGTMKIRYASDSASGLVSGPSTLLTFNLSVHATVGLTYVTVSGATGTSVINTGTLRFHLTSPVPGGTLLPGGTADPLGGTGALRLTGTIHCYLLCAVIKAPVSTPVPIVTTTFAQPFGPLYGASGTPHTVIGTQFADFSFDVYNASGNQAHVLATTFIVGREVLREPVPEPSTLTLFSLGVTSLGILMLRRRSRTAQP